MRVLDIIESFLKKVMDEPTVEVVVPQKPLDGRARRLVQLQSAQARLLERRNGIAPSVHQIWEEASATQERLESIRQAINSENVSIGELIELESLANDIDPGDVQLLEWSGVPEFPEDADE